MATITDYLDLATLRELQRAFGAVAQAPLLVCDAAGVAIVDGPGGDAQAPPPPGALDVPVTVDGSVVGRVRANGTPQAADGPPRTEHLLRLMAGVLGRLCKGEDRLRARAGELAALFALTAEFSGQRDLDSLLDLVARAVVSTLWAKACSIRLLNEDRTELVIKAAVNFSPEYLNKGPILLSESLIDQEVLATGAPVYVADERTDPRVLYPKEARREGIVSALCAPLTYKGRHEGVIRVYTDAPHEFDWFEASLLESIAAQAAAAIVNARLHEQTAAARNLKRHLRTAAVVQRRMTPAEPPDIPGFDFVAVYVPCFELGGDFYDFIHLPADNLGVAVCDVVGKGVRASLLMASVRASLRAHAANIYAMATILDRVNRDLCASSQESDFATLFYGVIDARSRRFTYANAGHPPPLLFRDGQCRRLHAGGPIIGINPDLHWPQEHFTLQSGDVILAYTDGLSDALNFEDEVFSSARIEQAAAAAIRQPQNANGIAQHVLWEMRRFAGLQTRLDDLTLVVIAVQ